MSSRHFAPDVPAGEVWYTASLEGRLIARSGDLRLLLDSVGRQLGSPDEAGEP